MTFLTFSSVAEKTGRCREVIGSLSNSDGDGYENVTLIRQMWAIFLELNSEGCIKVQEKKRKVVVLCSRPRQNVKLGTFTL